MSYLLYIDPDEPDVVVILSELPVIVEFVMFVPPVMLVSGVPCSVRLRNSVLLMQAYLPLLQKEESLELIVFS